MLKASILATQFFLNHSPSKTNLNPPQAGCFTSSSGNLDFCFFCAVHKTFCAQHKKTPTNMFFFKLHRRNHSRPHNPLFLCKTEQNRCKTLIGNTFHPSSAFFMASPCRWIFFCSDMAGKIMIFFSDLWCGRPGIHLFSLPSFDKIFFAIILLIGVQTLPAHGLFALGP